MGIMSQKATRIPFEPQAVAKAAPAPEPPVEARLAQPASTELVVRFKGEMRGELAEVFAQEATRKRITPAELATRVIEGHARRLQFLRKP